jgi:hypothetical protein
MLTKRQNFIETIKGGTPDRFVNQFEPFNLIIGTDPLSQTYPPPLKGTTWVNPWGVTNTFAEGTPGPMPVHDDDHIILKDITKWRDIIKEPKLDFSEKDWELADKVAASTNRADQFLCLFMAPGLLEQTHHFMSMETAMMAYVLEPEEVIALVDYLVEWEIKYAGMLMERLHFDALYRHDDWGSSTSTLLSPAMFDELFLPAYKKLYGWYKANGVEIIVHHSDSYAATLVPEMIDIGIDVWQGCIASNDVPSLIKEYGGKISFMGNIDNSIIDRADWREEQIREVVDNACRSCGKLYYIPNTCMGEPGSVFPGVYEAVSREIERMSKEMF